MEKEEILVTLKECHSATELYLEEDKCLYGSSNLTQIDFV